jgi:chorismate mutase
MNVNLKVNLLESWVKIKSKPLVIAGPCSAETPEQLFATAKALKAIEKVDIIRTDI